MTGEPDIIKQLRQAEQEGTLTAEISTSFEEVDAVDEVDEEKEFSSSIKFEHGSMPYEWDSFEEDTVYRSLFESSSDGIVVLDLDGVIQFCNLAMVRLVGYAKDEFIGKKFFDTDIFSEKEKTTVSDMLSNFFQRKDVDSFETSIYRKDGTEFTAEITFSSLKKEGQKIGIQTTIHPIHKQYLKKTTSENPELDFRLLFEHMQNGFALHKIITNESNEPVDYIFLDVNNAFERLTGLKKDQAIGEKVTEVIPGIENETFQWIRKYGDVALKGKELRFEQHAENLNRWFSVYAYSPKKGYFVTIFEDISEKKNHEKKILESEKSIRRVIEASPDSIVVTDLNGNIVECNQATLEVFGYSSKEDLIGRNTFDFFMKEDQKRAIENLKRTLSEGSIKNVEYQLLRKDGSEFSGELSANVIKNSSDEPVYFVAITKDITHRKKEEYHYKKLTEFEHVINKISSNFARLNPGEEDNAIDQALSQIGRLMDADRSYLFLLSENGKNISDTHEWCRQGIQPQIDNLKDISLELEMPWFSKQIRKGNVFQIDDVESLPFDARSEKQHLSAQNIQSLIIVPLLTGSRLLGFIGFDMVRTRKSWSAQDQRILSLVGEIFSRTLERIQSRNELQKSEHLYRSIIENIQDVFYRSDRDGKLIMISPSALNMFGYNSMDEVIGLDIANDFYFNSKERTTFLKALRENDGRITNYEIDLKRKDGSKVSVLTSSTYYTDEEGNIAGIEGIFSDISQRKHDEKRMKLLVDMLDVAPCSIMVHDFDGTILYANDKTFEMHGYDKHEFLTLKLFEIDVPESAELIQERMENIRANGEATFEVTHHRKDGSTFPMSAYVKIVDWNGKPALLSIGSDISERKEYEAQLKTSQKRLDTLLSNTPAVIYSYEASKDGMKITYINENLKHIIGFEPNDFIGNEQFQQQCIHPEDRKIVFEEISEMIAGEKDESYVTYRFKDKNGDYRWLSDSHKVISRKNGHVEVVGAWWDATDQKQAQQKLANSEKNFRTFFETMDDLIFIGNKKGEIFYANSAVTKKLGYSEEELNGMHVLDVHPDSKRPEAEQIFADMFSGKRDSCPLPLARKDGSFVPVETRVWFGEWDGKECIFGISKDLSKQQAALDRFHKLFDNNPALMAVSSMPDRHFVDVNNAFLEKLGYDREEIIGSTSAELNIFVGHDKQKLIAEKLATDGRLSNIELKVRKKDGGLLTGLFSGEIIDNQGDKSFLTVMTDLTEQKEAEKKLKEKLDELERWKKVTVNRELRIRELKKKLEKLENTVK